MTRTRKSVAILVEDLYQELEVWYPLLRFREAGLKVVVVGPERREYTSKLGYPVLADTTMTEVSAEDFAAVIIPGGYAPDRMRRYPELVNLVRDADRAGKIVAAICHGGWMLASAGILQDRTVTCYFAIRDDLIHAGARYVDQEVVRDANLITARKPEDLPAFCKSILEALG